MKTNERYIWAITLKGASTKLIAKDAEMDFIGTFDEALSRADEFECEVDFNVIQCVITRGWRFVLVDEKLSKWDRIKIGARWFYTLAMGDQCQFRTTYIRRINRQKRKA